MRKLLPREAAHLCGHLLRLTTEERALRFMAAVSDSSVQGHCQRLDWQRTVIVGFFSGGVLRGAAELQFARGRSPARCEVALTVETAWQDRGVATDLLRRALVVARNRRVRAVQVNCREDNHRMRRVAGKFGAKFRYSAAAMDVQAEIALAAATSFSKLKEWIDNTLGRMYAAMEAAYRPPASAARGPIVT